MLQSRARYLHPNCSAYVVDLRVVDNLVGDVELPVGERTLCLICHPNGPLDAPAVAVSLCQLDCDLALLPDIALLAHLSDQTSG
jgi:hypothetical protein